RKHRLAEPGIVPEFKRNANSLWKNRQKIRQQHEVALQERRQLKKNRTELACGCERLQRNDEPVEGLLGVAQALDVGDRLMRFGGELEMRGRDFDPAAKHLL